MSTEKQQPEAEQQPAPAPAQDDNDFPLGNGALFAGVEALK